MTKEGQMKSLINQAYKRIAIYFCYMLIYARYFPIQNFPNIVPRISLSCSISPVISPNACNA